MRSELLDVEAAIGTLEREAGAQAPPSTVLAGV